MADVSDRMGMPFLVAGQAQKEWTHNEALAVLDMAVHPCVQGVGTDVPPAAPVAGQAWIVGREPVGDWAGHADALAGWTAGGWRFVRAAEGMAVWLAPEQVTARHSGGRWIVGDLRARRVLVDGRPVLGARGSAIPDPSGGATQDTEGRRALAAVLAAMRAHGLIAE